MTAKKEIVPDLSPDNVREVAMSALMHVAADALTPAAARAAAARTLLEATGSIGRNQDLSRGQAERAASEMTSGEIADEISRLAKKLPTTRLKKVI